jgi:heptaprenylglyceryl phosphate synthase
MKIINFFNKTIKLNFMTKLIVLIDPNDRNLDQLIEGVNREQPENTWVGCSVSNGDQIKDIFERLKTEASLYPGRPDQMIAAGNSAKTIFAPDPLLYDKSIEPIRKAFLDLARTFGEKTRFMHYIVLHYECSAARVLGIDYIAEDQEILKSLKEKKEHDIIYLEAGSRNHDSPIDRRVDLVFKIKNQYPAVEIICGGGITNLDQALELAQTGCCDHIVVSNAIHQHPKELKQYIQSFKKI